LVSLHGLRRKGKGGGSVTRGVLVVVLIVASLLLVAAAILLADRAAKAPDAGTAHRLDIRSRNLSIAASVSGVVAMYGFISLN
jgi:uncharacterized membrane protein YidH (DUF202 family)